MKGSSPGRSHRGPSHVKTSDCSGVSLPTRGRDRIPSLLKSQTLQEARFNFFISASSAAAGAGAFFFPGAASVRMRVWRLAGGRPAPAAASLCGFEYGDILLQQIVGKIGEGDPLFGGEG
jgi:hypothetical protein